MFDLSPTSLLTAYINGVFPMADARDGEVGWYSPEERGVLELENLRVSRSLRKAVARSRFRTTIDLDFLTVIRLCGELREETWISQEIEDAYIHLHSLGFAHSVECWLNDELVGGLYGVSINGAFFGESMFHRATDASKVALVRLVNHLRERGMELLDTQYLTDHLASLGAVEMGRKEYLGRLSSALSSSATFSDVTPSVSVTSSSDEADDAAPDEQSQHPIE